MKFIPRFFCVASFLVFAATSQAVVIIQDNFNYTDSNLQGNTPNVASLAGTTFEQRISTYNNIDTNGTYARSNGDQQNGIGISTGAYVGSISRISVDLIVTAFPTTGATVMGAGFWSTFPGNSGSTNGTFTGFRVNIRGTGISYVVNGSTKETISVDLSALTTATPYTLSYNINADGSYSNLVFNGTDYTSSFALSSVGDFSGTRTNYAGAVIAGGSNARGGWDNFVVEAVPEPGSGALLLLGLGSLLGLRSRRRA